MNLDVKDLCFSYGKRLVLDRISFRAVPGELVAVLGPNGAGKTTLLKCLNGIRRSPPGSVLIGNRPLSRMRPEEVARAVGYVPQRIDTARLTVFDAVLLGRSPHIRWKVGLHDLGKVNAALEQLGIATLALRHTDELSGGELQKVAIARALVQEPRILLFDEPTSALDLRAQVHIMQLIRRVVTGHGLAAITTMHDLNAALHFADRFVFLKEGAIRFHGRRDEVTAEIVEAVYGLPVEIHRIKGRPFVLPVEPIETINPMEKNDEMHHPE